jgi:hypothetical protein
MSDTTINKNKQETKVNKLTSFIDMILPIKLDCEAAASKGNFSNAID